MPNLGGGLSCPARCQVHHLPVPPSLKVTEHRAHTERGPNYRTRTRATFPADVAELVKCGPAWRCWRPTCRQAAARPRTQALAIPVACMDETDHGLCNGAYIVELTGPDIRRECRCRKAGLG